MSEKQSMQTQQTVDASSNIGKAMFIIVWLLVFGLLGFFFHHWTKGENNPNQTLNTIRGTNGIKQVVLKANRRHHYIFTVPINGTSVAFLIDTGAPSVSIPEHVAKRLQLQRGASMRARTANGTVTVYATRIARIQIGDITLKNVRAHINPGMKSNVVLLGMSALKQLEIRQRDGQMILIQHVNLGD